MALWIKILLTIFCLVVIGVGLIMWFGAARQRKETSRLIGKLVQSSSLNADKRVDFERFRKLPAPVARYFRAALKDGQPFIRVARFSQNGELRINQKSNRWSHFEASQVVAPQAPGFIWNARIYIAPLLHVRVRDAYVAGQGSGQVSMMSSITLAHDKGRHELNSGALHRYLAEAVWYPTALLPEEGVQWSKLDNNRAIATLTNSGVTVSLEFRFNNAGEITGIYTPERYGLFDGEYVQYPWGGSFSELRGTTGYENTNRRRRRMAFAGRMVVVLERQYRRYRL